MENAQFNKPPEIRTVNVVRYVTPLREGGSLPAIVEADDGFLYVLKFKGAGQGTKALVADYLGGEIARQMNLKVPESVWALMDAAFGKTEPDEEIQDLLKASTGLNLGVHYLSSAITYDPAVTTLDGLTASKIVLLDALITNVDRTPRNTNMLMWKKELWLIDHGAAFYFHHSWSNWEVQSQSLFPLIKDHVLLHQATELETACIFLQQNITEPWIAALCSTLPDEWLTTYNNELDTGEIKNVYTRFITQRLQLLPQLKTEIIHAQQTAI